jgi:hypothetical protein
MYHYYYYYCYYCYVLHFSAFHILVYILVYIIQENSGVLPKHISKSEQKSVLLCISYGHVLVFHVLRWLSCS